MIAILAFSPNFRERYLDIDFFIIFINRRYYPQGRSTLVFRKSENIQGTTLLNLVEPTFLRRDTDTYVSSIHVCCSPKVKFYPRNTLQVVS